MTGIVYSTSSQRAASSFRNALVRPAPQAFAAQRDLSAFFQTLYDNLFQHPETFGLPLGPDRSIAAGEPNEKDRKQEVMRVIRKPRTMIQQGLDFLMQAGLRGRLAGDTLILEDFSATSKESGIPKKFLQGFAGCGLKVDVEGPCAKISSSVYPALAAGLQTLALACQKSRLGKFHFARCDFRAADPNYEVDVLELYQVFEPQAAEIATRLHQFFDSKGYTATLESNAPFQWVVKYQGNRKIKATPFFQIEFDERYADPLRLVLKPASANRLADLLPGQPQFLQDDFIRRVYQCRGSECDWCRNQKSLGPSVVHYNGEDRTVCWFSNGDIRERDEPVLELIAQYAALHDQLLPQA